jgi:hypothetical protein
MRAADLFKENCDAGDEIARAYEAASWGRCAADHADRRRRQPLRRPSPWDKAITPGLQQDFCTTR